MRYGPLRLELNPHVYTPDEDSFLLAKNAFNAGEVLEIGCGCGIVSLSWALKNNSVLGVDINPFALLLSIKNAALNNINNVSFRFSDLFENVSGYYDLILFNPPYLPTSQEEKVEGLLNYAFDGGKNGSELIVRFLREFPSFSSNAYLVVSSLNLPHIKEELARYRWFIKEKRSFFFETIYLLSIVAG